VLGAWEIEVWEVFVEVATDEWFNGIVTHVNGDARSNDHHMFVQVEKS
jgi:hypothetical protein